MSVEKAKMPTSKKRAAEDPAPAKKAKKRKSKHAAEDENLDAELGLNTLFAKMDSQLLADYHVQKLARFGTDLSPVELSDLALSGNSHSSHVCLERKQKGVSFVLYPLNANYDGLQPLLSKTLPHGSKLDH
jgi:hypothetical protein